MRHPILPPDTPAAVALAIRLSLRDPGPKDEAALRLLEDQAGRRAFHDWAMNQGVLGLALNSLRQLGWLEGVDPAAAEKILAPLKILRQQARLWDLERDRVLALLGRLNIAPVVLKGGALREVAYQDPVERPVGDLDLLVEKGEMPRALQALTGGGYTAPDPEMIRRFETDHFHLPLTNRGGFEVELHWGLGQPSAPWQLDPAGMLARAVSVPSTRGEMRVPTVEDMVVHLCSQNTEDDFSKLRRLVDIDRVTAVQPPDWDRIVSLSRAGGLEIIVGLSLQLAHRLLGTPLRAGMLQDLVPSRLTRLHLSLLQPEAGLLAGTGQAMDAGSKALSLWLTAPRHRMRHLRNILRREEQMGLHPGSGPGHKWLSGMGMAIRLAAFHGLLWARGLLRMVGDSRQATPRLWDECPGTES